jgi:glycosyltransferase involved in cell wall biosynthesis
MTPEFELVVPAWNEARSLPALVDAAAAAAGRAGFAPGAFALVVVDNGSTDDTPAVLASLASSPRGAFLRTVRVETNRGYGHGVMAGLRATTAEVVGWTHADLQCDPYDAFRALEALRRAGERRAIAKGSRTGRPLRDVAVSRAFEAAVRAVLHLRVAELNAQPKVFHRSLLDALASPPDDFAFDAYVLWRAVATGLEVVTIDVRFPPRVHGVSRWAATLPGRWRTMVRTVRTLRRIAATEART